MFSRSGTEGMADFGRMISDFHLRLSAQSAGACLLATAQRAWLISEGGFRILICDYLRNLRETFPRNGTEGMADFGGMISDFHLRLSAQSAGEACFSQRHRGNG
jgi:hypothetical protein